MVAAVDDTILLKMGRHRAMRRPWHVLSLDANSHSSRVSLITMLMNFKKWFINGLINIFVKNICTYGNTFHSVAISFRSLQRKIAIDDSRLIDDCNCRETNKRNSISSGFRHLLTYRNTTLIYPVS